jgi:hypothetical protein
LLEKTEDEFAPARDLAQWVRSVFIDDGAALENPEHAHLQHAEIGFLWTNVGNARQGRRIIGQCELGEPQGAVGRWAKARARQQVREWFEDVPDFIITIDAHYAAVCGDAEFCALIEHELFHASQAKDLFGAPKFNREGMPVWAMRGHDVEEFVGVVRRYGAEAAGVDEMVRAANQGPEIAKATIEHTCGTCSRRVA